ncbi:MAG: helix-turn-helix transcriptional regulator [Candidatus Magasanikbacteria bacterium]|nr:helix-turn-helix transcriptional regulator [Candidatus Magasanikbacteria bacterium]NCS72295.1 helix-turn-helix transcriptional regulator [Candidatus Magasanikbacteria bacterium]
MEFHLSAEHLFIRIDQAFQTQYNTTGVTITFYRYMKPNILNIGKNLKKIRTEKGISQDRLSKLADVALNTIVTLESGNNGNPTIETMTKIAQALEVDINDLMK